MVKMGRVGDGDIRVGSISVHRTGAGAQSSRVKGSYRVGEWSDFKASGGWVRQSARAGRKSLDSFSSWQVVPVGASLSGGHHPEQRNQGLGCWRVSRG